MAAEGDWIAALYEQAQQQGPEAMARFEQAYGGLRDTVGQQAMQQEAARGGGTWSGDNYFAAGTPQADAARADETSGKTWDALGGMYQQQQNDGTYGMSAEQRAAYDQANANDARFGSDLSWLDPAFQQQTALLGQSARSGAQSDKAAQDAQYAALQRAAGMTDTPLDFQGSGQQQGLMDRWGAVQGGEGAPMFDGSRQQEQYGNLNEIIAGGGATAIEMANRQKQRADQESWLRGQREADLADYAERGLAGSGNELLALSSDRQAAAGRNSLADLDTAKALEERRLGAINSAAGLAGQMRGAEYTEKGYLDKRMLDALNAQTSLSGQMRDQTMQEQLGGRKAQESGLQMAGDLASQIRDSSFSEAESRAMGADQFSQLNQSAINAASSANAAFKQNAYQDMMRRRQEWQQNLLNQGINVSGDLMNSDQRDNVAGFGQGTQLGTSDANAFNTAKSGFNNALLGQSAQNSQQSVNQQMTANQLESMGGQWMGDVIGTVGQAGMSAATGPTGGGGGGMSGAPLSQAGTTWSGAGSSPSGGTPEYNDLWDKVKAGK
jgi:hypothetical protein